MGFHELGSDSEKAEYLQNLLVSRATGGNAEDGDYKLLRNHFLSKPGIADAVPQFVRTNRDLSQFWGFIKYEFQHYAERRDFIWKAFGPLLDRLEGNAAKPSDGPITDGLRKFDPEGVHAVWSKALERRETDPEGAITAARTLLETVCRHVLDHAGVQYDPAKADLPELYKLVSKELNLSPSQHTFEIFKQILGGVASVVYGLGAMRNKLGDAHGQGKVSVRPAARHAELAVNLAGTTALFIVQTWAARSGPDA